ncbi:MAG: glycosyltransferase [Ornithinimicrobium sp.]
MIGMYLHHQGSGHRIRGTAIATEMTHQVTGLGSGTAPRGWPGPWVELPRDHDVYEGAQYVDPEASGLLHWAPLHHRGLLERQAIITAWVQSNRPDLMVVDTSTEVALLARLCGIPVVVSAMPGDRSDRAHRAAYDLATALLAPWPASTTRWPWPEAWLAKTFHAGGISRFAGRTASTASRAGLEHRVLVLWGRGGTDVSDEDIRDAHRATPGWTWVHRGGAHPPALDVWRELCEADVVVTHAGQNSVADVAAARRPAVVIAQQRPHFEQHATIDALERLGICPALVAWPAAEEWNAVLERALSCGGQGWKAWDGPGAAGAGRWLDEQADTFTHLRRTGARP